MLELVIAFRSLNLNVYLAFTLSGDNTYRIDFKLVGYAIGTHHTAVCSCSVSSAQLSAVGTFLGWLFLLP